MKKNLILTLAYTMYENNNDALNPEVWANEALMVLESNLVMANLVHRDFEDEIANFGDTVNAHRPGTFKMKRKASGQDVTVQDATVEGIPVQLNQLGHVTFGIEDTERSTAMKDLFALHLVPAMQAMAVGIDSVLLAQKYAFLNNIVGKIGTALTKQSLIDVQVKANGLKWPTTGRYGILTVNQDGDTKGITELTNAEKIGDDGTAMREGSIGRAFGTNWLMSQNNQAIAAGNTTVVGAVDNGSGYAKGATVLTVDGFTGALITGSWLTIAGDMTPLRIASHVETAGDTTQITLVSGLKSAVVNDAVITVYTPGAINNALGYAVNKKVMDGIVVDGFSVAPQSGQLVTFGTDAQSFAAFDDGTLSITKLNIDKPIKSALTNDEVVGIGPAGEFGLVFRKDAIAFVSRPLAEPPANSGVQSAVVNYNGLSVRVTMGYQMLAQKTLVTVDLLYGVDVIDANQGLLLLS